MRVIGTAGHVDHGKSTLVQRLTGINPDRLKEEKQRQMTIDLGFAWMHVQGEVVGIVDVPGHRDFIENMLAGVGGIDAVVLVIAADEGIMPQTLEHLAIIDLLGVSHGLVVLTKIDLVDDDEWLDLVELDVRETLEATALADVPITRVSAHTGEGLEAFLSALANVLEDTPDKQDSGQPRLPIDRVFSIAGFGTVVTGTLVGGSLKIGDTVELSPAKTTGRIRGLQSYKQSVDHVYPGNRVAVNLSGVERGDVGRGQVVSFPGVVNPTLLVDVHYQHLADASRPLNHNAEIKVFSGTSATTARARLLDKEIIASGESAWLQLRLEAPLPLAAGDRYILRFPSPPETIGGGIIVEPNPGKRHKRFQTDVIDRLEMLLQGTPADHVANAANEPEPVKLPTLMQKTGYSEEQVLAALAEAEKENQIVRVSDGFMTVASINSHMANLHRLISQFHDDYPLSMGIPREQARSQLRIKNATLQELLEQQEKIVPVNERLKLRSFSIQFTDAQERQIERLAEMMDRHPYSPPSFNDAAEIVGTDVLYALIDLEELVQVREDVIFTAQAFDQMVEITLGLLQAHERIDAKMLRDRLDTSRKYAISFLEYLDSLGITRRDGDERIRGKNAPAR